MAPLPWTLITESTSFAPFPPSGALGCNGTHFHRHGSYERKGTHGVAGLVVVLLYLCLDCRRTFGVLPPDILPICRAPLPLLKRVASLLEHGVASSRIGRRFRLSSGVMSRIQERILALGTALASLARAQGYLDGVRDPERLVDILRLTRRWPTWIIVAFLLSRVLYPRRWPTGPPNQRPTRFMHA